MGAVGKKLRRAVGQGTVSLMHWCPACDEPHGIRISGPAPTWAFNQDYDAPSFHPSVLCFTTFDHEGMPLPFGQKRTLCHYFLHRGSELKQHGANLEPKRSYISYCGDCPHEMRGKIVELPDWPGGDEDE